jgi:hypothetical protein
VTFEDETHKPNLGNLGTHTKEKHPEAIASEEVPPADRPAKVNHGYNDASTALMAEYLEEGRLNPTIEPDETGFRRYFTAWIIDQDLPFTTGEAALLHNLFKYLCIKFHLPSNTTVCNMLEELHNNLHSTIIKESTVHTHELIYVHRDMQLHVTGQYI